MTTVRTGNLITNCLSCGSHIVFRLDDSWIKIAEGFAPIISNPTQPAYCPLCKGEVEVEDEEIDQWEYFTRIAGFNVSPETVALVEQLYLAWKPAPTGTFIEFLKDFKESVTNANPTA